MYNIKKEGFFLPKSICIKTNNKDTINYILDELETLNLDVFYYSCRSFKNYTNIIIHYKGKAISLFLSSLSRILTYLVLDLYENYILKRLISTEYFYFSISEQKSIFEICINNLNCIESVNRFEILETSFYNYLSSNKSLNLKGFINFRLFDYIKYLDSIIDICVNKYIIDKEYLEFINVLKSYVNSSENSCSEIHLIYKTGDSILLDKNKNIISVNKNAFDAHFLSDISFSSNDYALNTLLTLIPSYLYVHLIDEEDEFINTLKLIFDSRIKLCTDCNICNFYRNSNLHNKIH